MSIIAAETKVNQMAICWDENDNGCSYGDSNEPLWFLATSTPVNAPANKYTCYDERS